jgi:hypothetical protein
VGDFNALQPNPDEEASKDPDLQNNEVAFDAAVYSLAANVKKSPRRRKAGSRFLADFFWGRDPDRPRN